MKIKEYKDVEAVLEGSFEEMFSLWEFYTYKNKQHLYQEAKVGHRVS